MLPDQLTALDFIEWECIVQIFSLKIDRIHTVLASGKLVLQKKFLANLYVNWSVTGLNFFRNLGGINM